LVDGIFFHKLRECGIDLSNHEASETACRWKMKRIFAAGLCLATLCSAAISEEPANTPADDATAFGALPFFYTVALSADGSRLAIVGAVKDTRTVRTVARPRA
jgi:hypothetical protein